FARFVGGGRVLELEFAVLEVCEDRGEEEGTRLIAVFPGLIHRGTQPLGQAHHVTRRAGGGPCGARRSSCACAARSVSRNDGASAGRKGFQPSRISSGSALARAQSSRHHE